MYYEKYVIKHIYSKLNYVHYTITKYSYRKMYNKY